VDKLELINLSFGLPAAQVLAAALRKLPKTVKIVNFADIIAGQETKEALQVLSEVCTAIAGQPLVELNLSDNALGPAGIDAVSPAFVGQTNLVRVFFNNNGLSSEATAKLPALIASAHGASPRLTHFECYNNMMGDDGAKAVAKIIENNAATLQHLRVATTRLSLKGGGGLALANALTKVRNLHHLDLSDNAIGVEAGHILAKHCLPNQSNLRYVALGDTGMTGDALEAVCRSLAHTTTLEVLELNHLEFGTTACVTLLAPLIARNRSLRKVNLEANELNADGVRAALVALDGCPHLSEVNLINNALSEKKGGFGVWFSQWMCRQPKLTRVKLAENQFTEKGASGLHKAISAGGGRSDVLDGLDDQEEPDDDEEAGSDVDNEGKAVESDED